MQNRDGILGFAGRSPANARSTSPLSFLSLAFEVVTTTRGESNPLGLALRNTLQLTGKPKVLQVAVNV